MGVLYVIIPLDERTADWLRGANLSVPTCDRPSRNPTPAEVRRVCDGLPGIVVGYNVRPGKVWQATLSGATDPEHEPWTSINIDPFTGDESEPHPIGFSKGWPVLIHRVANALATVCGPLVVYPDTGDPPAILTGVERFEDWSQMWPKAFG